jgi:hypothetical protein
MRTAGRIYLLVISAQHDAPDCVKIGFVSSLCVFRPGYRTPRLTNKFQFPLPSYPADNMRLQAYGLGRSSFTGQRVPWLN